MSSQFKKKMSNTGACLTLRLVCNSYVERSITNEMVDEYVRYIKPLSIAPKHHRAYRSIFAKGFLEFAIRPPFEKRYPKKTFQKEVPFQAIFADWKYCSTKFKEVLRVPVKVLAASMVFPYTVPPEFTPCILALGCSVQEATRSIAHTECTQSTYAVKLHPLVEDLAENCGMFLLKTGSKPAEKRACKHEQKVYEYFKKCGSPMDEGCVAQLRSGGVSESGVVTHHEVAVVDIAPGTPFLLLDRMYDWYDLEEFVQLREGLDAIQDVFMSVHRTMRHASDVCGFFHGNLHCKNVLVHPVSNAVKLTHLEYSGHVGSGTHYASSKSHAKSFDLYHHTLFDTPLTHANVFEDASNSVEKATFLHSFDMYRLFMSLLLVHHYCFWNFSNIPICATIQKHVATHKARDRKTAVISWEDMNTDRFFNDRLAFTKSATSTKSAKARGIRPVFRLTQKGAQKYPKNTKNDKI